MLPYRSNHELRFHVIREILLAKALYSDLESHFRSVLGPRKSHLTSLNLSVPYMCNILIKTY